jgi:hypothetical protein
MSEFLGRSSRHLGMYTYCDHYIIFDQQIHLHVTIALSDIIRVEGVFGLWKGIGPSLFGVLPARSLWFGSYNATKSQLENYTRSHDNNGYINFVSAVVAGISQAT